MLSACESAEVGVSDPGVEQPPRQPASRRTLRYGRPGEPPRDLLRPGRSQPQHPHRRTAGKHGPAGHETCPRIGPHPEPGRDKFVSRR